MLQPFPDKGIAKWMSNKNSSCSISEPIAMQPCFLPCVVVVVVPFSLSHPAPSLPVVRSSSRYLVRVGDRRKKDTVKLNDKRLCLFIVRVILVNLTFTDGL